MKLMLEQLLGKFKAINDLEFFCMVVSLVRTNRPDVVKKKALDNFGVQEDKTVSIYRESSMK